MPNSDFEDERAMRDEMEPISKHYHELEKEEPSKSLDIKIMAAAKAEMQTQAPRKSSGSPFGFSWRVPFAIASVAVICIALVPLMQERAAYETPRDVSAPVAPSAPAQEQDQATMLNQTPPSTPASNQASTAAAPAKPAQQTEQRSRREQKIEMRSKPEPPRERVTRETYDPRGNSADSAATASAPPAPALGGAAVDAFPNADSAARRAAAPAASAPTIEMQSKKEASKSASEVSQARSPEEWLKEIEQLRGQGKINEARDELKKFKKAYPDYELPAKLNALEK